MTYIIELSPEEETRIAAARERGVDFDRIVRALISGLPTRTESLDEVLEPFRRGFAASGATEEEAVADFEAELKAVRQARRAR